MSQDTTTFSVATRKDDISIDTVRRDVNTRLQIIFRERASQAQFISERYTDLWQATATYVLAGGKRIRPYLTVMGYNLFGGTEYAKILPIAVAQELLNQALLMHDDIIDRDYVRYGAPNVAGQFRDYYKNNRGYSDENALHYADSAALLAGDLCISEAFSQILQAGFSPVQTNTLQQYLHEGMFTVAGGELLDSETFGAAIEQTDTLAIAHHKTAVYSVVVPLLSGAYVAGASNDDLRSLRQFAESLGVAYQLADDILGVFGDDTITGKTNLGDLREGKHTFMMAQTWQRANSEQRKTLEALFAKPTLTQQEADSIREIIVSSSARKEVDVKIDEFLKQALTALDACAGNDHVKEQLRAFSYKAVRRDK